MTDMFKVVNTTRKGPWVALELRSRTGNITPVMLRLLRKHNHVRKVESMNKPTKLFIITSIPQYAKNGKLRRAFVANLGKMASAAS